MGCNKDKEGRIVQKKMSLLIYVNTVLQMGTGLHIFGHVTSVAPRIAMSVCQYRNNYCMDCHKIVHRDLLTIGDEDG